jgi:hypothetical protein
VSTTEIVYIAIGLASIAIVLIVNRHLFRAGPLTPVEGAYIVTGLIALMVGWYFNTLYFREYGDQGNWLHWTKMLFVNPASASGGQDLIIANLVLFPIWTLVDGRRRGMRAAWLYFPVSVVTSYAFGLALYLVVRERQRRWNRVA